MVLEGLCPRGCVDLTTLRVEREHFVRWTDSKDRSLLAGKPPDLLPVSLSEVTGNSTVGLNSCCLSRERTLWSREGSSTRLR